MLPNSWFGIASFLVLAAPGVLLDLLAGRRRVRPDESALRELGRVALVSVCFSVAGLAVAAGLAALAPNVFLGPDVIAFGSRADLKAAPGSAAATAAAVLAVSLGLVWAFDLLRRRPQDAALSGLSGWQQALRGDLPNGHYTVAQVRLTTGTVVTGRVRSYTADFEIVDRELVLCPPLFEGQSGEAQKPLSAEWQRLVVHGSQVASLVIAYAPERSAGTADAGAEPTRPR